MIPKNSIELQADINAKMSVVIDKVAKELVEKLMTIIDEKVYAVHPNLWGGRTFEFGDSWYNTAVTTMGNYISSTIQQDYATMIVNTKTKSHIDRENLAEIIETGIGYDFNTSIGERPFWQEFETYCDTNIDRMIKTEMRAVGLYTI